MPDPSKWIAGAMVGTTLVVIVVGAIVLKTMLDTPADPACDHLKGLADGDKVVELLQRYLEAHGTHETGSCHATVQSLDKMLGHDKAPAMVDCLVHATSVADAAKCIPAD